MIGAFKTIQDCVSDLESKGFSFYLIDKGYEIYINRKLGEIAQVNVYRDTSASALIGKMSL